MKGKQVTKNQEKQTILCTEKSWGKGRKEGKWLKEGHKKIKRGRWDRESTSKETMGINIQGGRDVDRKRSLQQFTFKRIRQFGTGWKRRIISSFPASTWKI